MKCCIIGLGVFGKNIAVNLAQMGADVLAIDRREENISQIKDEVSAAVVMDFNDPSTLAHFPLDEMDAVVIAIGDDFEKSMALTVKAQELKTKKLVCRVLSPMHERLLRLLKVDRLVVPEEVAARGLAHSIFMRGVVDGFDMGNGHSIIEARPPSKLVEGSLLTKGDLFKQGGVWLVTIKRIDNSLLGKIIKDDNEPEQRKTLGVVKLDEVFREDDILVLFGKEKNLRRFLEVHA